MTEVYYYNKESHEPIPGSLHGYWLKIYEIGQRNVKVVRLSKEVFNKYFTKVPAKLKTTDKDLIYSTLNGEEPGGNPLSNRQEFIRKYVGHTSISVGDIIKIGAVYWMCMSIGWAKIKWVK